MEHYDQPAVGDRRFFTAADRPKMEILVHNLEHGYTVLWYDESAGDAKKSDLEALAKVANRVDAASGKFIVSAWDPSYGALPTGKKFVLSHWSATFEADKTTVASQAGNRQLCGDLSGEVVKAFIQKFPRTASPEPTPHSVRPTGRELPHLRRDVRPPEINGVRRWVFAYLAGRDAGRVRLPRPLRQSSS